MTPPAHVLAAFGAPGGPVLLPGGQGQTWRAGDVVLKPAGLPVEAEWVAETLTALPESPEYRVARPIRAASGWVVDGWAAWRAVPGEPDPRRVADILRVGTALHEPLAGLPRPAFLDTRDDPWTYGDRVAAGELPLTGAEPMADLLVPLAAARRPVRAPAQPVHGDLLGNVLFDGAGPPAVIDFSLHFRPAAWALAVAVVDALAWHGAPAAVAERDEPDWDQMLLRALMFRIATNEGFRRAGLPVRERTEHYRRAVAIVHALTGI